MIYALLLKISAILAILFMYAHSAGAGEAGCLEHTPMYNAALRSSAPLAFADLRTVLPSNCTAAVAGCGRCTTIDIADYEQAIRAMYPDIDPEFVPMQIYNDRSTGEYVYASAPCEWNIPSNLIMANPVWLDQLADVCPQYSFLEPYVVLGRAVIDRIHADFETCCRPTPAPAIPTDIVIHVVGVCATIAVLACCGVTYNACRAKGAGEAADTPAGAPGVDLEALRRVTSPRTIVGFTADGAVFSEPT